MPAHIPQRPDASDELAQWVKSFGGDAPRPSVHHETVEDAAPYAVRASAHEQDQGDDFVYAACPECGGTHHPENPCPPVHGGPVAMPDVPADIKQAASRARPETPCRNCGQRNLWLDDIDGTLHCRSCGKQTPLGADVDPEQALDWEDYNSPEALPAYEGPELGVVRQGASEDEEPEPAWKGFHEQFDENGIAKPPPAKANLFEPGMPITYHNPRGIDYDGTGEFDPDPMHGAEGYYLRPDPHYDGAHFVDFPGHGNWVMGENLRHRDGGEDPTWNEFWRGSSTQVAIPRGVAYVGVTALSLPAALKHGLPAGADLKRSRKAARPTGREVVLDIDPGHLQQQAVTASHGAPVPPHAIRGYWRGIGPQMSFTRHENYLPVGVSPQRIAKPVDEGYWEEETSPEMSAFRDGEPGRWESLYHGTRADRVDRIYEEGLRPWDELGRHNWQREEEDKPSWLTPRPGHTYLTRNREYALRIAPRSTYGDSSVLEIDPAHLDPQHVNPDEDSAEGDDYRHNGPFPTKGQAAEEIGLGDDPSETRHYLNNGDTLAYRGTIPPHAIKGRWGQGFGGWSFTANPAYQPAGGVTASTADDLNAIPVQPHVVIHAPDEWSEWHDEDGFDPETLSETTHPLDPHDEYQSIPEQAAELLRDHGLTEASSSEHHTGNWYSNPDESGHSGHLNGLTPEHEREVWAILKSKDQRVPDSPPLGHPLDWTASTRTAIVAINPNGWSRGLVTPDKRVHIWPEDEGTHGAYIRNVLGDFSTRGYDTFLVDPWRKPQGVSDPAHHELVDAALGRKPAVTAAIPMGWQDMYHVSPRKNRESILQHGLQGAKHDALGTPWMDKKNVGQPPGNYFFDNPEDAHDYVYGLHTNALGKPLDTEPDWEEMYEQEPEPEGFHDWSEDDQDDWRDNADYHEKTDDPNGYDVWKVKMNGHPIAPDPENALVEKEPWDLGRIHDTYQEELDRYAPHKPLPGQLHGDVGGMWGATPNRYFSPVDVPAHKVELYEHHPSWNLNESDYHDRIDNTADRESPDPWHALPLTQRPIPGHESSTSHNPLVSQATQEYTDQDEDRSEHDARPHRRDGLLGLSSGLWSSDVGNGAGLPSLQDAERGSRSRGARLAAGNPEVEWMAQNHPDFVHQGFNQNYHPIYHYTDPNHGGVHVVTGYLGGGSKKSPVNESILNLITRRCRGGTCSHTFSGVDPANQGFALDEEQQQAFKPFSHGQQVTYQGQPWLINGGPESLYGEHHYDLLSPTTGEVAQTVPHSELQVDSRTGSRIYTQARTSKSTEPDKTPGRLRRLARRLKR